MPNTSPYAWNPWHPNPPNRYQPTNRTLWIKKNWPNLTNDIRQVFVNVANHMMQNPPEILKGLTFEEHVTGDYTRAYAKAHICHAWKKHQQRKSQKTYIEALSLDWNTFVTKSINFLEKEKRKCPLTHEFILPSNLVTLSSGYSFDKNALREWFLLSSYQNRTCPVTKIFQPKLFFRIPELEHYLKTAAAQQIQSAWRNSKNKI